MPKDFDWAIKTLLGMCNVPASPSNIAAFHNHRENQQWIFSILRMAQPQIGAMNSSYYAKIIEILEANGVPCNPYLPGGGF